MDGSLRPSLRGGYSAFGKHAFHTFEAEAVVAARLIWTRRDACCQENRFQLRLP